MIWQQQQQIDINMIYLFRSRLSVERNSSGRFVGHTQKYCRQYKERRLNGQKSTRLPKLLSWTNCIVHRKIYRIFEGQPPRCGRAFGHQAQAQSLKQFRKIQNIRNTPKGAHDANTKGFSASKKDPMRSSRSRPDINTQKPNLVYSRGGPERRRRVHDFTLERGRSKAHAVPAVQVEDFFFQAPLGERKMRREANKQYLGRMFIRGHDESSPEGYRNSKPNRRKASDCTL